MGDRETANIADNTPVLVGAGQLVEHVTADDTPALNGPMELAAAASRRALADAGGTLNAGDIDAIAMVRLFSDSAPAWSCPFGGSDNPPESVARRIEASPQTRIYSDANGTEPLKLLAELAGGIARGEISCALLNGAEAMANQRHAMRAGIELDWSEQIDLPLDSRLDLSEVASPGERVSGMYLPTHYYALIENYRAWQQGHSPQQHLEAMAQMLAPFSEVASGNPYAYWRDAYNAGELIAESGDNYPISLPYRKRLVAQDAVNQAAALVLTSAGMARDKGIAPDQWIFLQGYAEGIDQFTSQRLDPGTSVAMQRVFQQALDSANADSREFDLIDIYSCFPCAVAAACDALSLPQDGSRALTVTGGLPFFGGPGSNYSMHALAEMAWQLRGTDERALVTANGGILSKHAAAVLSNAPHAAGGAPLELSSGDLARVSKDGIATRPEAASPGAGTILSYTVIYERKRPDLAVILGETANGERFLANSAEPGLVESLKQASPIGRQVQVSATERGNSFSLAD